MAIPIQIPTTINQPEADFSKPSSDLEVLGATFVQSFRESSIGRLQRLGSTAIHTIGDESPMLEPDELNRRFPEMDIPFNKPTSTRKAEFLAKRARDVKFLGRIANNHRDSTVLNLSKMAVGFGSAALDPIGIASGLAVEVGVARALGQTIWGAKLVGASAKAAARAKAAGKALKAKTISSGTITARNAAEGVIGNVLEEVTLGVYTSKEDQADYDAAENISMAIAAGALMPVVIKGGGAILKKAKRFSDNHFLNKSPEFTDKAAALAMHQAERGQSVDVTAVVNQAKRESLEEMEVELDDLREMDTEKFTPEEVENHKVYTKEVEDSVDEIKNIKEDPQEVAMRANSIEEDLYYNKDHDLGELDLEPPEETTINNQKYKESIETKLEETQQIHNLEDSDPILVTARQDIERVDIADLAAKQAIGCLGRS